MKFKLLRRRMSISAPKMTIKTHIPWPLRMFSVILLLSISIALGLWIYDTGKRFSGISRDDETGEKLRAQVATLTADRDQLRTAANSIESRLSMEHAVQQKLVSQVRSLELENAKLKEDLAFFENLSTHGSAVSAGGIAIKRFQVEPDDVPGQMRYRILVTQGGRQNQNFSGNLQLILTIQQAGKTVIMKLPDDLPKSDPKSFQVNLRLYQRLEGTFNLPAHTVLTQAQARILERGAIRVQQTVVVQQSVKN